MSRIVKVSNGDYRLQVQAGGNIIFDTTGTIPTNTLGTVTIYGNLDVKGTTTTVESSNTTVKDNILQLNFGQTGNGISGANNYQSGVEVERGAYSAAQLVFNEQVSHWDSATNTQKNGTWVSKTADNALSGMQLNAIVGSGAYNLSFDMQGGNGILSVANSINYEARVLNDNDIPNKKYVDAFISSSLGQAVVSIVRYPLSGPISTKVETTGSSINFNIGVDLLASITAGGFTTGNLGLFGDTITNTSSNNLILTSVNNNIEFNAILNLDNQTSSVLPTGGRTKLYSTALAGPGKTGLFISNTTTSDELVSKNRAVLLSILL